MARTATFTPTIGLEVHIEAETETKMFCSCKNDPAEQHPNQNVCPICMGHPGTLPTINEAAVQLVIRLGLALGGTVSDKSHFDRKSYFYPDLPKGYQISQYEEPFVTGGELRGVQITRIHLEEDTGRLVHSPDGKRSLVDFNRAGVPLIELVTEPDIRSADEAVAFARELRFILRYLGISNADMERGQMRIEANVSLNMGVKVELKNINSFKAVRDAISSELKRQEKVLVKGGDITQETRGWDEDKGTTRPQRSKEYAHDYRYFPEPDLPPVDVEDAFDIEELKAGLPELPQAKRERFRKEYDLPEDAVNLLVEDEELGTYFEEAVSELKAISRKSDPAVLYNYLTVDLRGLMNEAKVGMEQLRVDTEELAHLVVMVESGKLSSRLAKDVLVKMFETGEDPEAIVKEAGLAVIGDRSELLELAKEVITKNKKAVEDYKKGKETALKFLIGQLMRETKGQAEPETAQKVLEELLG